MNEGTETFTILSGGNPIGSAVSATVSSGSVTASYTLPGGTTVGTYTIKAVYNGTVDYGTSTDTSQSLTIIAPAHDHVEHHNSPHRRRLGHTR